MTNKFGEGPHPGTAAGQSRGPLLGGRGALPALPRFLSLILVRCGSAGCCMARQAKVQRGTVGNRHGWVRNGSARPG